MIETVISSLVSFVGTNIDDIFINTLFFSEVDTKAKTRSVVIGKYLGIGALVFISLLGAFGLSFISQQYIGFLGIIPIILGVKEWLCYVKSNDSEETDDLRKKSGGLILNVMLVTMANGADNIGVYIPLFAGFKLWQLITVICVFAVMTALWCVLGKKLSDLKFLQRFLSQNKHIIVPIVYIALGVYIILKNVL